MCLPGLQRLPGSPQGPGYRQSRSLRSDERFIKLDTVQTISNGSTHIFRFRLLLLVIDVHVPVQRLSQLPAQSDRLVDPTGRPPL
jgi:hypothetical protein